MSAALDRQKLPLPSSHDTGGHGGRVTKPALDPYWLEDVNFLSYQPPPLDGDLASLDEWNERLSFLEDDLHWLLKQPHHLFWSQVVFDDTLQKALDSYLHHAPRPYDPEVDLPANIEERHQTIHRLIFMVFLRMATYKESKEHFITPCVFGDILYENFLFDIVKMMELCVLYGAGNSKLLSKMIDNIFTQQPKYNDDLRCTVPTILEVLHKIEEKCGKTQEAEESLKKLGSSLDSHSIETMGTKELQDIIFYIMDTAQSLAAFLEIYPNAAFAFQENDFVSRVASFYESLMPELEMALKNQKWESQSMRTTAKKYLHLAKVGLAQVCSTIISACCIRPILESNGTSQLQHIDEYLELLASLLSEKHFLSTLASHSDIEDDIDLIMQSTDQIDETRTQFIIDGVLAVKKKRKSRTEPTQGGAENVVQRDVGKAADFGSVVAEPEDYQTDAFLDEYGYAATATNQLSAIELDSLICSVKDLFPELGDGFIEACLEEYNYDSSKVINDILEDKLPPGLRELDKNLERRSITPPPPPADVPAEKMLSKRANIYENDEFDVFNRDNVDTSRIHKGKKMETGTANSVLADKRAVQAVKAVYDEYSYEYEDEYDDTYDAQNVGARDADSADELFSKSLLGRPLTTPRILQGAQEDSQEDDNEEEEEEKDQFERPTQHHNQAPRFQHGKKKTQQEQDKRDARQAAIQGQAKGKGQSQNTQRERTYKNKNKSSRANHNRKAGADKKRRGGYMAPAM